MDSIQTDFDSHAAVYPERSEDAANRQNQEETVSKSAHENSPPQPKELTKEEKEAVSWWKNPLQG